MSKSVAMKSIPQEMFERVDIDQVASSDQIAGKPSTLSRDVVKRFSKNKWAVAAFVIFAFVVLLAIIVPIAYPGGLTNKVVENLPYTWLAPRMPLLGLDGSMAGGYTASVYEWENIINTPLAREQGAFHVAEIVTDKITGKLIEVKLDYFNPYLLVEGGHNIRTLWGTNEYNFDYFVVAMYATRSAIILALIVSALSVIIGAIYGTIAGTFVGKNIDIVMMRFVDIIQGVPLIIWIIIFSLIIAPTSNLSLPLLGVVLVITGWMWTAQVARTFVIKYKNAEFVEAARTLGASQARIIVSHLMPNISGRLAISFVNKIPAIIFFEASLVFLGIRGVEPLDPSLGSLINLTRDRDLYLLLPVLILVLITLTSQVIANNLNDALDPRVTN